MAIIQTRAGISPIGTVSANTGSVGNTGSSYAPNAYQSGVNVRGSGTSYAVQDTDYGGLVAFNTASAVAISLNSAVQTNFQVLVNNYGNGALTLTPTTGTVNGSSSVTLQGGVPTEVYFDGTNWWASAFTGVLPQTIDSTSGEYLTGYNAGTGAFSVNPTPGINAIIALAKLTTMGANGSFTVVGGLVTAYTPPS